MKNYNTQEWRKLIALTSLALLIIASQAGCVPVDDKAVSDFVSTLATDFVNQTVNFVVSFARSGLAAFLL